jgi:hypothetical protein
MLGAFVSMQDYRDYSGYGNVQAPGEIADLHKALSAGDDVNNPGTGAGVGFPLRTESLEATLKNLTYEMDEIKLFKSIPKVPASNTVEEFNRLLSYGEGGARSFNQGFFSEGGLPEEQDSTYERVTVLIKFLGVVGRVTHVANTIRAAHGNVIALETMNKTMELLRNLENALFFGDSSLIPEQWDGIYTLVEDGAPDNVIDLRGGPLTEELLNDMLLTIRDNFGQATDGYFGTGPFADLAKQVYDRQRFAYAPAPGTLGATVTAFQGQHGKINLHDHVFITPGQLAKAAGLGRADRRPLAPTITVAPAAGANPASQFGAADAGTYIYRVVAGNKYGLSVPVNSASVAVVAGDGVTFTVADGGQDTTYYEVYRTAAGAAVGTARLMARVARTGATQVITDLNADLPGTSKGFVLMQNTRSFSWSQLLPMTRIPLAAIDTSIRWAQVIYGAIKMYTPTKNVVVKNIGRASGSLPQP